MLASLDRLGVTAFIVNANGTVHQQNDCARNLLAGDESVSVANSRLRFSDPALNTTLETALRKATQPARRSSLFPVRAGKNEVYEVNVSPLQACRDGGTCASPAACARGHCAAAARRRAHRTARAPSLTASRRPRRASWLR